MLPLSGGHDSRALLVGLLATGARPTCVTWGLSSSLTQAGNDAYVAQQLTTHFGLEHLYCPLDPTGEPMRDVLTRFLLAGEGRAEDFSAYTDGMKTWERLFESGVTTVVRGDTPGLGSGQGRPYDPVNDFKVRGRITEVRPGPVVTLFELEPAWCAGSALPGSTFRRPCAGGRARAWAATATACTTNTSWRPCSPP